LDNSLRESGNLLQIKETYDVINPATEERIYGQTVALDL
jgi:hypothetical protein